MPNEPQWTPFSAVVRAVIVLQKRNYDNVIRGTGLSSKQMAELLDTETGYSDLYEALEALVKADEEQYGPTLYHTDSPYGKAKAALAKARGETPDAR